MKTKQFRLVQNGWLLNFFRGHTNITIMVFPPQLLLDGNKTGCIEILDERVVASVTARSAGRPGRTRTCDSAVMSGEF
jgi:hypothetical protein